MEGLQLTYMLEDLNGLRTVQKEQADALLTAKSSPASPTTSISPAVSLVPPLGASTAAPTQPQQHSQQTLQPPSQGQRHHTRTNSASGLMSRGASPAIFDKSNSRRLFTPPLTRNNSHQGSVPGTPRHTVEQVEEPSLVLQELRKRLQKQELADLKRMRDAIAAMHSTQQQQHQWQQGDASGREGAPDLTRKSFSYTGSPRSTVL